MANVIEIANSAYEERDKAQEKLALLMKRAEREAAAQDMKLLNQDLMMHQSHQSFKNQNGT